MADNNARETTPLLQGDPESQTPGPAQDPILIRRQHAFRIATLSSLSFGTFTILLALIFLVLFANAPAGYSYPWYIVSSLAPVSGFGLVAAIHSLLAVIDGSPLRGSLFGILVDIFAGLYFLFEGLWILVFQATSRSNGTGWYEGCRNYGRGDYEGCVAWERGVRPLIWIYPMALLGFG
jgi:hypothetical protein